METKHPNNKEQGLIKMIQRMLNLIIVLVAFIVLLPLVIYNVDTISSWFKPTNIKAVTPPFPETKTANKTSEVTTTDAFWQPEAMDAVADPALKEQVYYGRELIAHTAKYLGPNGSVLQITNGQNCQNCHLQAGTMVFGNNYGSVAATYPKFRARSGTSENIYKRVNDCFERSLNGKALDTASKEMQAIVAYINHIGSNVPKGEKAVGAGLKELAFLDRAADPIKGKIVYETKCQSCHQANGEGVLNPDKIEYSFPPLWGKHSFNDGAGLYRITNFAKFIKYNMPLGITHENPQLTDEEAWDVSAFVLAQSRPHISVPNDWPDITKKPIDHPFGPYADPFSEKQHKYGPFKPIAEKAKKIIPMSNNRRKFIQQIGALGGVGLVSATGMNEAVAAVENQVDAGLIQANGTTILTILQTTDVHCQVHPHDELFWENGKAVFRKTGGYAHLASYLAKEKKINPNSFLIDTGDMFQGSELSVKTLGKAMVPILNALNYDLYLPGNWEVIYYKKAMQTLLGALHAPKVCANMYHDLGEGKKGELIFPPYHIWHSNGVKIGFIGYTDPLVPLRQSPNYSKGIIYTKPEENLAHYVDVLRNQEQCAAVMVIAHLGLSQQLHLANQPECNGVDYILGGDTHERVRKPIVCKYAKVVEPGAFGSFVGKLQLSFKDGKLIDDQYSLDEVDASIYKADKQMTSLINQYEQPFANQIYKVAGYSTIPLYRYFVVENPIDTLILNALKWKLPETDIVLSNGFRFCPPRTTPDSTGNIPITEGFIFDMLPVDSTVRTGAVTGKQILDWLEKELNNVFAKDAVERFGGWVIKFKGMTVKFEAFAEKGNRVKEVKVGGTLLDINKTYSICACERDGDPADMLCRMRNVKNPQNTPYTLHSTMLDYLKKNSPVTPTPEKNAIILDAPDSLLSQVTGVDYEFR